ncbi:hypothetical protein DdX_11981 [Ditylenchus destructor]|uniref:Protein kinase domain-containing protein n=1 Tax=Ditylenchus destructor TaxID=166010 RepID=A0AAD4MYJ9_9BILA|nr:hypothetical protein DdX_11981 [Ditylenchus destructor]
MDSRIPIRVLLYSVLLGTCFNFGVLTQDTECLGIRHIQRAELASRLYGQELESGRDSFELGEPIGEDSDGLLLSCRTGFLFWKQQCTVKISQFTKSLRDDIIRRETVILKKLKDRQPNALSIQILAYGESRFEGVRLSWCAIRQEKGTVLDALTMCAGNRKLPFIVSPAAAAVLLHAYMQILQSIHRARCLHLNMNLRHIYITAEGELVAGNFSKAEFPADFSALKNGMVAELVETTKFLLEENSRFLQTEIWDTYETIIKDFTSKAREIVNRLKNVALADYSPLQSIFGEMLLLEQYNGKINWLNKKESDLLSARARQMIDQANMERAAREAGER